MKNRVAVAVVRALSLCALAAVSSVSCAKVTVRKVPTPTQYINLTTDQANALQKEADAMEGLRFYLPRPFVSVFESFPIGTDIYLAHGTVSADGQFVYINSIAPLTTRVDVTRPASAAEVANFPAVPAAAIIVPRAQNAGRNGASGTLRSGEPEDDDASALTSLDERLAALEKLVAEGRIDAAVASKSAKDAIDAAKESKDASADAAEHAADVKKAAADAGKRGSAASAETGKNSRTMANSNGAFAYTPLRGNLDIVYLPDFDEQYVVSSQANLGNASFMMNMGQGWSLQGFNSISDNSELNKRIFALIDKASELAFMAADAGMAALFPPTGALAAADRLASLRSGDSEPLTLPAGTPVTLRIVVVHYAAKGLYPVIKPRELKEAGSSRLFLDLYASRNASGSVLSYNAAAIDRAIDHYDQLQRRFTVPVYPYQYISFNTFRYVSIEALTPAGSGRGELYDKTGTAGDPGDRQAADLADLLRELLKQNFGTVSEGGEKPPPTTSSLTPDMIASRLATALNRAETREALAAKLNGALGLSGDDQIKIASMAVSAAEAGSPQTFAVTVTTDKPIASDKLKNAQATLAAAILDLIKAEDGDKPGPVAQAITSADQIVITTQVTE